MVGVSVHGTGHDSAGAVSHPAVFDGSRLVVGRGHPFVGDVVGIEDVVSGYALQIDGEVEAFPRKAVDHREQPIRIRITDDCTVILIDDAVAVQVLEADVARCSAAFLVCMTVHFFLRLEDAVGDISVEDIYRQAVALHCDI